MTANRLRLDPDPVRPDDTDRDPEPDPELEAARAARGCMVAIVLGAVIWILVLFLIRAGLGVTAIAPSADAATPYAWSPEPAEDFRPVPTGRDVITASPTIGPAPTRTPKPTTSPQPRPTVDARHGRFLIAGYATMTDTRVAAMGAYLRIALERRGIFDWRGRTIRVWHNGQPVDVVLGDTCACADRHGQHTLIDLPPWAFAAFGEAPGVLDVRLELKP